MPEEQLRTAVDRIRRFAVERDWEQFHSPKNLSMALSGEVGELVAEFQWLTEAESQTLSVGQREAVAAEVADVAIYLLRLVDVLGIDLINEVHRKLDEGDHRYPARVVRGSAQKRPRPQGPRSERPDDAAPVPDPKTGEA